MNAMESRRITSVLAATAMAAVLASCAAYDRNAGLEQADYENLMGRRGVEQARIQEEPPIPDLQPILAAPTPPGLADQRRVTVNATPATPVSDLLVELARQAEVDLDLDPRISGGIFIQARERPIEDVVRRISDLAGLRYSLEDNVLRVELDEPFMHHYRLDMLNMRRTVTSRVEATTQLGQDNSGGGSVVSIDMASETDFWAELREGIEAIVTEATPAQRLAGAATPPAEPVAETEDGAEIPDTPAAPAAPAAPAGGTLDGARGLDAQYFTINRQAGMLTVFTTQAKQRRIEAYLDELRRATTAQVLIEAKVVEVDLNDQFRAGINWSFLNARNLTFTSNMATGILPPDFATRGPTLTGRIGENLRTGQGLEGLLNLLDTFGSTRTLSSPRLTVTNNETALLKVARNEVYFELRVTRAEPTAAVPNPTPTYSSTVRTVPIGLLLNVQPTINPTTNQISLNLRPTISRVVDRVADPAVALQNIPGASSLIPVVEVREIDSVVTMESGSVLIMGGLMQERSENMNESIPGLSEVPVAGNLFKRQQRDTEVIELVIFLRATIVHGRDSVHPADIDLYNTFTPDPRPMVF